MLTVSQASRILNVSRWGVPVIYREPPCGEDNCQLVTEKCLWPTDYASKLNVSSANHLAFGILRVRARLHEVPLCWAEYHEDLRATVLSMMPVTEWDALALRLTRRSHEQRQGGRLRDTINDDDAPFLPPLSNRSLYIMTDNEELALKITRPLAAMGQRILTASSLRGHNYTGRPRMDVLLTDIMVASHARTFHPSHGSTLSGHVERLRRCGGHTKSHHPTPEERQERQRRAERERRARLAREY
jgi:rRNA maturation protein Nop10